MEEENFMPWCPKCKAEYREGFTICSDCNVELVTELESTPDGNANLVYDREAFLISVTDDSEAKAIEALLRPYGISVLRKYKGAGEYLQVYMGLTIYGIDLFVSSRELETAKEVIDAMNESNVELEKDNIEEEILSYSESEYSKRKRRKIWTIALIFAPGILLMVISIIWEFFI